LEGRASTATWKVYPSLSAGRAGPRKNKFPAQERRIEVR
jgi:hypothetical protein